MKIEVESLWTNSTRQQIVSVREINDTHIWYYCGIVRKQFRRQIDSFTNLYLPL